VISCLSERLLLVRDGQLCTRDDAIIVHVDGGTAVDKPSTVVFQQLRRAPSCRTVSGASSNAILVSTHSIPIECFSFLFFSFFFLRGSSLHVRGTGGFVEEYEHANRTRKSIGSYQTRVCEMKSVKIRCETTCLVAAVKFQKVQKFKKKKKKPSSLSGLN
jgi:hypothetical protein